MTITGKQSSGRLSRILISSAFLLGFACLAFGHEPPVLSSSDLGALRPNPTEYVDEGMLSLEQQAQFFTACRSRENVTNSSTEADDALDSLRRDATLPYVFRRSATMEFFMAKLANNEVMQALEVTRQWIRENPTDAVNVRLACRMVSCFRDGTSENLKCSALERLKIIDSLMEQVFVAGQPCDSDLISAKLFYAQVVRVCCDRDLIEWRTTDEFKAKEEDHGLAAEKRRKPYLERCVLLLGEANTMLDKLTKELSVLPDPYGDVAVEISRLQGLGGLVEAGVKQTVVDLEQCQVRIASLRNAETDGQE